LERLPGVKRADVKLETGQAEVLYDDTKQTPEKLAAAIDRLGFRASVVSVGEPPRSEAAPKR
jgi:copper chaperone CopZ